MTKAIIIRTSTRPIASKTKSLNSIELWYLREWWLDEGFADECYIGGAKIREAKHQDFVVDCDDLNEYDEVIVQASLPVFFGGVCQPHTLKWSRLLAEYKGPVTYTNTDTLIDIHNFAKKIHDRWPELGITAAHAYQQHLQLTRSQTLFAGADYASWQAKQSDEQKLVRPHPRNFADFYKYVARKTLKLYPPVDMEAAEFWLAYWGGKRSEDRQKKLREFLPVAKSLCVGHYNKSADESREYLDHADLPLHIRRAAFALIVADDCHDKGWFLMRVLEAPYAGLVSMVHLKYDPYMKYYEDPIVRSLCYFNSAYELEQNIARISKDPELYLRLLTSQRAEWGLNVQTS